MKNYVLKYHENPSFILLYTKKYEQVLKELNIFKQNV